MAQHEPDGWVGVRERVLALGGSRHAHVVFGAHDPDGHRFDLEAPLTEAELAELETAVGVELPEDYRQFLLRVGAGGAGPGYGLTAVRTRHDGWAWDVDTDVMRLAAPFNGPVLAQRQAALDQRRPRREQFLDAATYWVAVAAWSAEEDALYDEERTQGAISLAHQGGGYSDWLAVSGAHRGTVWTDGAAAGEDFRPTATSFGAWYLDWLAAAEAAVAGRRLRSRVARLWRRAVSAVLPRSR